MKSERNRIVQIVLTGFLVGLCFVVIVFWVDASLKLLGWSQPMFDQAQIRVKHFDISPLMGDTPLPEPNVVICAPPQLVSQNWSLHPEVLLPRTLLPALWETVFLKRLWNVASPTVTFQSKGDKYSIRWDAGGGLLVKERIEPERENDAPVTPVTYIGPKGVSEAPDLTLGRFEHPRFYHYKPRDELFICDADLSRFYLADMQQGRVVAIKTPELTMVDLSRGVLVKGGILLQFQLQPARRQETDLEMDKRYEDRGLDVVQVMGMGYGVESPWTPKSSELDPNMEVSKDGLVVIEVARERIDIPLERPKIHFALLNSDPWVLDDQGTIYSLSRETLAWVPRGGLPRCGVQATADPSQLLAYHIAPIYVEGRYVGLAAASLSKDAREYVVALYDAAGEQTKRDRIEHDREYFQYAHIATSGRAVLNFIQPLTFSLAATFLGPRCEASASYRALLVSPFSIPARLASDLRMDWQDRYGTLVMWNVFTMSFGLLLGIAAMQDAKRQGIASQTATRWCYICIPFGLIAFFTYMIWRPRIRRVTCTNCGNARRPDQEHCHHCDIDWDMPDLQVPAWKVLGKSERQKSNAEDHLAQGHCEESAEG